MRAVQVTGFGDPEVLETTEVPDPIAGPGEVVVDVSAADVITLDTVLRRGEGREYFAVEPPYVPGTGVAGEVISVGEGMDAVWIGRRIVALTGVTGGYAERAVIAERELISVPDELGLDASGWWAAAHCWRARSPLRPRAEGVGEVSMGLAAGAGAPVAGLVVAFGDFTALSLAGALVATTAALALAFTRRAG